jgi:hypothetical protein
VDLLDMLDLGTQTCLDPLRERNDAVLVALPFPDHDLAAGEVEILHAQPAGLEQPEAGAVHELGHQARHAGHSV